MKFTQISTLALAAMMAFSSCSKEEVMNPGEADLQSGEALLSFKIGGKTTTYATGSDELKVNELQVFMTYADSSNVRKLIKIPSTSVTTEGVNYTLKKGSYKVNTDATLYFVANVGDNTLPKDLTDTTAFKTVVESSSIYTITDAGKATNSLTLDSRGMTATKTFNVTLKQGLIQTSKDGSIVGGQLTLKRLAARVFVKSLTNKYKDIKGFTIEIDNLSKGAKLFDHTADRSGTVTPLAPYIISGDSIGQYKNTEAVGYVYPSTSDDLVVTITPPASYIGVLSQKINFKPDANKNYQITIDPGTGGATIKFAVTIQEWTDGENLATGPFTPPSLVGSEGPAGTPIVVSPSASIQDGNLVLVPVTSNTIDLNKMIYLGTGNTIGTDEKGFTATTTITGTPNRTDGAVTLTPGTGSNINLSYVANYSPNDITGQTIEITIKKGTAHLSTFKVPIIIKATPLPADFTFKTYTGAEFMQMSTRGTITEDIAAFNYIINTTPNKGASFGEALVYFYMGGYNAGRMTLADGPLSPTQVLIGKIGATCPPGFKIPTEAQYASITGNTKLVDFNVTVAGTWYGGNGTTTTRHRILRDDSGVTTNYQYFRNVEFNGKQMTIFYPITRSTRTNSAEAVETFGGNNAMGIDTHSSEWLKFYKPFNLGAGGVLTRCVKDASAPNAIWK